MNYYIARFRIGNELVSEPMALPLEQVLSYNPLSVRDESGKYVIWNSRPIKARRG